MKTQNEQWKAIAECNGEYYISDHGRIKSFKYGKERILKQAIQSTGYLAVAICYPVGKKKSQTIHKLVALAFIQNLNNKLEVNHKDGNKTNNHVDNLEWLTHQENMQHARSSGLCENNRIAVSKPVIDILTKKQYNSLTEACREINEPYDRHAMRHHKNSPRQRFFYL